MTVLPHYATSLEHPSIMQAPVNTTQTVPPAWQGKFALFSSKPGSKSQYSGRLSVPAAEVPQLVAYLQHMPPNERGEVEMWLTGFLNSAKTTGQQYIGGYVSPQQQGPAVAYAQQQMAPPAVQQPAPPVQPTPWQAPQQMASPAVQQQYQQPAPSVRPAPWQPPQQQPALEDASPF